MNDSRGVSLTETLKKLRRRKEVLEEIAKRLNRYGIRVKITSDLTFEWSDKSLEEFLAWLWSKQ